jgi:hypothetical protein
MIFDLFKRLMFHFVSFWLLSLESTNVVAVAPLQRASKETAFPACTT